MIFLIVCVLEGLSNFISSSNDSRESDDLPKSPRVHIDKLIHFMVEKLGVKSNSRECTLYFAVFLLLLICILDSSATVTSRIYREVVLNSNRSGLRECPVMWLGDRDEGRSAYNKQVGNDKKVFAR